MVPRAVKCSDMLVAILILVYVAISSTLIHLPGVQFDEVLHVNAALGGLDGSFIYKSIFDVPVLLMPYIGALKAYITAPVFAIFGVSVFTVRLPMILLAALSLLFLFWANKKYFSIGIATIALWLLAIDPNFIALTRLDSGPVVLGFMMSVLALLFFKKFLKNQKIIFLFLTFAALGLGIFHKLNFVWFINGFIFSALIIYYRELIEILKRKSKSARILIIGLFVGGYGTLAGLFIYASYKFALFGTSSLSGIDWYVRAYNTSTSLMYLLNGELYLNYSLTNYHSVLGIAYFIFAALVILLGLFFAIRDKGRQLKYLPPYFFVWLIFIAVLAQYFVTKNAVWPWHIFEVQPMLVILMAYGLYAIYQKLKQTRVSKRSLKAAAIITIVLVSAYNLFTYGQYIKAYNEPTKNIFWSTAIYDLIDYTSESQEKFVSIDWGTHTQLLVFSQDPEKFKNESFRLNTSKLTESASQRFIDIYLSDEEYLFVLHNESKSLFPDARQNFFNLVDRSGKSAELINEIKDGNQTIIEVYRVSSQI